MRFPPYAHSARLAAASLGGSPAWSAPLRVALVIANGRYASLPAFAQCTASAAAVRDALQEKGFEIIERNDLGSGEFDAAIGAWRTGRRRAAAGVRGALLLRLCRGVQRPLVPSPGLRERCARKRRPHPRHHLQEPRRQPRPRRGEHGRHPARHLSTARVSAATALRASASRSSRGRFAVIGVANESGIAGPTPASQAVRGQLAGDDVTLDPFVAGMRDQLAKAPSVATYVVAATGKPAFLPARPSRSRRRRRRLRPSPMHSRSRPGAAVGPKPAPTPSAPRQVMGDEDQMSEQDRRQVQVAVGDAGLLLRPH